MSRLNVVWDIYLRHKHTQMKHAVWFSPPLGRICQYERNIRIIGYYSNSATAICYCVALCNLKILPLQEEKKESEVKSSCPPFSCCLSFTCRLPAPPLLFCGCSSSRGRGQIIYGLRRKGLTHLLSKSTKPKKGLCVEAGFNSMSALLLLLCKTLEAHVYCS